MGKYGAPPAPYTSSDKTRKENKNNIAKKIFGKLWSLITMRLKAVCTMQTLGLKRTLHPTQHFWAHKLFLKTPKKFLYVCGMGYLWATHTPTCSSSFVVKTATLPFPPPSQERKKSLFLFFEKCGALMSPVSAPSFPWEVGGAVVTYDAQARP